MTLHIITILLLLSQFIIYTVDMYWCIGKLNVLLQLHGTLRRKDRIYREDIFHGKGKSFSEASDREIQADIQERESENPLAYKENVLEYKLTDADIMVINRKKSC